MIFNEYGTTGKRVSAIGFAGMRFEEKESQRLRGRTLMKASLPIKICISAKSPAATPVIIPSL